MWACKWLTLREVKATRYHPNAGGPHNDLQCVGESAAVCSERFKNYVSKRHIMHDRSSFYRIHFYTILLRLQKCMTKKDSKCLNLSCLCISDQLLCMSLPSESSPWKLSSCLYFTSEWPWKQNKAKRKEKAPKKRRLRTHQIRYFSYKALILQEIMENTMNIGHLHSRGTITSWQRYGEEGWRR